jgi:hypothetical protein
MLRLFELVWLPARISAFVFFALLPLQFASFGDDWDKALGRAPRMIYCGRLRANEAIIVKEGLRRLLYSSTYFMKP